MSTIILQFEIPFKCIVFIETHERFSVLPTREFASEADRLFGEDTFYAKVDTSLPERRMKAWEKENDEWR